MKLSKKMKAELFPQSKKEWIECIALAIMWGAFSFYFWWIAVDAI